MSKQFDLEQSIMDCWHVVDDLKVLTEAILDGPKPLTEDEITNITIGMEQLYQLKFDKCFRTFEDYLKERKEQSPQIIDVRITIIQDEINRLESKFEPFDTGHYKTAVSVLKERLIELQRVKLELEC